MVQLRETSCSVNKAKTPYGVGTANRLPTLIVRFEEQLCQVIGVSPHAAAVGRRHNGLKRPPEKCPCEPAITEFFGTRYNEMCEVKTPLDFP
jgi:hypothetical protein